MKKLISILYRNLSSKYILLHLGPHSLTQYLVFQLLRSYYDPLHIPKVIYFSSNLNTHSSFFPVLSFKSHSINPVCYSTLLTFLCSRMQPNAKFKCLSDLRILNQNHHKVFMAWFYWQLTVCYKRKSTELGIN